MAIMTGKVTYGRLLALIFVLQLIYPPISAELEIIPEPDGVPLYGFKGKNASLWCRISGVDPPPTVTWSRRNGQFIGTGEELKFDPLKLEDEGEYTCRAGNKYRIFDVKVYDTEILGGFSGEQTRIRNNHGRDGNILTWYHSWVVPRGEENNKVATWRVNDGQVSNSEHGYTVDRNTGDLLIYDVTLTNGGMYTSKMFGFSFGERFNHSFLHVYIAPSSIVMEGLDAPVVENREIIITCNVPRVKPANVTFVWSLTSNEGTVPVGTQSYKKNTDGTFSVTGRLKWNFKRRGENGYLMCIAKHGVNPIRTASQQKKIIVIYPFKVKTVEESSSERPVRGRNKRLRCQTVMEGKPRTGRYSWYKDGQEPLREGKYSGTGTKLLTITDLDDGDIGKYECRIVNDAGQSSSDNFYNLEKVLYAPVISMGCPEPINESHTSVINCHIDAEPAVKDEEIEWLFNGDILKTGPIYNLFDTSRADRGVYTCQAKNIIGNATGNCTVVVNYGPTGTPNINRKDSKAKVEEEFRLTCNVHHLDNGHPKASEFVWKKDKEVIQDQHRGTYSLIPKLVTDGGEYSCALKNAYGKTDFGKTNVTIEAPIKIEGETQMQTFRPRYNNKDFVLSYNVSGTIEKSFTLKNMSQDVTNTSFEKEERTVKGIFSYGQKTAQRVDWKWQLQPSYFNNCSSITFFNGDYSFMAEGTEAGQSSSKTVVSRIVVQYPPIWGSSSKVQSSALDMNKTLFCDVCAEPPVDQYEWTFKGSSIGNDPKLEISVNSGDKFGLYICRAQNAVGGNTFSITLEEKGSPHTPEDFRVISRTSRTLLVKWTVTFNGGFDLEKFELNVNDSKNANTHTVTDCLNSKECLFRIRDLDPKKMYWLQVRAKNKWGDYARSYSSYDETRGRTQAKPNFVPLNPEVRDNYMMVKWLYDPRDQRKRRSTEVNDDVVGLVVEYKKEKEPEFRQYPLNGKIPVVDQSAKIEGSFDPTTNYHIVYTLYEGEELAFTLDPEVISADSTEEAANAGVVAGAIIGVILVILLVVVIAVILLRRRKQRRPRLDMDKNSHSQPPLALESNIGGSEDGRLEHNPRPPMPGGKPTLVHGPENRNGMKPENPYENVTPPYANVKKRPRISSSQTSLYDNAQYEDFEFSKSQENGTQAHGDSVAPIPAKRKSKAKPKTPEEEDPQGLLYADLTFDEHGQRKQQVTPEQIHGIDGRVDYASLDFDQMKANARAGPHPLMPAEEESPYHNVDPRGKPV